MKKLGALSIKILLTAFFLYSPKSIAQGVVSTSTPPEKATVTVHQDSRIKEALAIKSKMNFDDNFKIQLYYGNLSGANNVIGKFRKDFSEYPSSIEYETPNHKVWVGNFRNRIAADRALIKIQQKFSNAFVFKP